MDQQASMKKQSKMSRLKWGIVTICLCLLTVGALALTLVGCHAAPNKPPQPQKVQVANPIITVQSVEEMEKLLDFQVPLLDKKVESLSVLVLKEYPSMAQISYADGSEFRMQYGSGDISGINGGTLVKSEQIDDVKVDFYQYEKTNYALWESKGFTCSYVYTDGKGADEIAALLKKMK